MKEPVRVVIVDRNDWFREMAEESLGEFGVETVGGSRSPEGAREVILRRAPQVLVWTSELDDQGGERVLRLLAGLPTSLVPAVVVLGEYMMPLGIGRLGGCCSAGKADGMRALVKAIQLAAGERETVLEALAGRKRWQDAADTLLNALMMDMDAPGTRYLRRGLELWIERGEQPETMYAVIGETFSASAPAVERAVRAVIADAWRSSPAYVRMLVFEREWEEPPSNAAFIGTLAGRLLDSRE